MDILVETTTSQISDTTMIGKTITALGITMRSIVAAMAAASHTKAALAVGMAEASAVAMAVVVATVAAGIAEQLGRSDHA
jgi:hypothetical protein